MTPTGNSSDRTTYAPFLLITGVVDSLILTDDSMLERANVFEERAPEGWIGNGYDWTAVARLILAEKLPALIDKIEFDPEAGMFSAHAAEDALRSLAPEMQRAFNEPDLLRDYLARAHPE